ncbi:tetratricopeptide repeat protein [Longibaculum muris]|uniref:tetratricopeptide repeat protein n=1 Tax=Longibaculum muris TaxID=1796628 RepID=UPI0022DF164E|nr:tetratricopeptide repeat protein [Longibaculum muris]
MGIENTYLYLYYRLIETCLFARQYKNDEFVLKYFSIFDLIIDKFDKRIFEFYQIIKYTFYKERRKFDLCALDDEFIESYSMDDEMKAMYYYTFSLRYMYEGNIFDEYKYLNLAKEFCKKTQNTKRLIGLTTVECDCYEKLGDLNKVISILNGSLAKIEENQFYEHKYIFMSNAGITYCRMKNYEKAIEYLSDSFKHNDDNLDLFYLIYSYMSIGNKDKAIELLKNDIKYKIFQVSIMIC